MTTSQNDVEVPAEPTVSDPRRSAASILAFVQGLIGLPVLVVVLLNARLLDDAPGFYPLAPISAVVLLAVLVAGIIGIRRPGSDSMKMVIGALYLSLALSAAWMMAAVLAYYSDPTIGSNNEALLSVLTVVGYAIWLPMPLIGFALGRLELYRRRVALAQSAS